MSATADKGVVCPSSVGTRRLAIVSRSWRAPSGRRTRIGTRSSPSEYFATLASMSPIVATRSTWASVRLSMLSRAASSARGVTINSGPAGGGAGRGSEMDRTLRIWRSNSVWVRSSAWPSSPASTILTDADPNVPWFDRRTSGMSRSLGRMICRNSSVVTSRSCFSTTVSVPVRRSSPPPKPPDVDPTWAKTRSTAGSADSIRVASLTARAMSSRVAPGGPCTAMYR